VLFVIAKRNGHKNAHPIRVNSCARNTEEFMTRIDRSAGRDVRDVQYSGLFQKYDVELAPEIRDDSQSGTPGKSYVALVLRLRSIPGVPKRLPTPIGSGTNAISSYTICLQDCG
jgi:hypothetical protein